MIRELRSTFERVHLPRRSEVDAAAGVLVAERQLEARKVDTEQAGVVDSGGTRTAERTCPACARRQTTRIEERSDGNAPSHLRHQRATTRAYRQWSRREICALDEVEQRR